ncbi:MAG TPA: DoxX family protein [Gemmatimonadaceae bacterium]|jgi:putative oxidoreductase|nr:DoxX family protein [Gemmatimonadaceae bacterium]
MTNIFAWVLQVLLALAFLGAGGSKVAGAAQMVEMFGKIGVGQWFRYVTGFLEIAGAIGILIPRTRFYSALLLAAVMVGAIIAHLTLVGGNPTPPIVLLVMAATVAYLRQP